jgi:hypothetical protein
MFQEGKRMREVELQSMIDGLNEVESGLSTVDSQALPEDMRIRLNIIRARLQRAQTLVEEIRKDSGPETKDARRKNPD